MSSSVFDGSEGDARRSIVLDSDSPYYVDFSLSAMSEAVYFYGSDKLFGPVVAVIYKSPGAPRRKLSSIFISQHGTSGFLNMTIGTESRYYVACQNLAEKHSQSLVRQALAITCLRTFATMNRQTRAELLERSTDASYDWDETVAGSLASSMHLMNCRFPDEIGQMIQRIGIVDPKHVRSTVVDVVYEDSDSTIDQNNELVYLFGNQLEQLFDPLSEYSPEPTELLYIPPFGSSNSNESEVVKTICEELFMLQSNFQQALNKFLQEFLIPLRVKVLGGEIPGMTIRKLNTIFPPTVDEIVRVNSIFYEALEAAMPYGSFEVVKASGITIPYFYKACMRHEAASKNFSRNLNYHYPTLEKYFRKFSIQKIENIIHCSIHLTKVKLILDRLMTTKTQEESWPKETMVNAQDYYQSATGTIDAFGKEVNVKAYDRRVFTPTGKILVEVAHNWPKELEYGWISRRIVTIFDGTSVLDRDEQHIIIIFTDYVVVLKKSENGPSNIPALSTPNPNRPAPGVRAPSIADQLLHSMVNEMPLYNLPELEVVGWTGIEKVVFAEHHERSVMMLTKDPKLCMKMYQLDPAAHLKSSHIVELGVKARIMNKTQPFHLFKAEKQKFQSYATVHELQGYLQEIHKCSIAVFMNVNVGPDLLEANNLQACFSVQFIDRETTEREIRVIGYSRLGYELDKVVSTGEFREFMLSEISYVQTLNLSCANDEWREALIDGNASLTSLLLKFGTTPSAKRSEYVVSGDGKVMKREISNHAVRLLTSEESPTTGYFKQREAADQAKHTVGPSEDVLAAIERSESNPLPNQHHYFDHHNLSPPLSATAESLLSAIPSPSAAPSLSLSRSPSPDISLRDNSPPLRNKKSTEHLRARYGNLASDDEDFREDGEEYGWEDVSSALKFGSSDDIDQEFSDSDDERRARDVEEWYHTLSREEDDLESLNSDNEEDEFDTPLNIEGKDGFHDSGEEGDYEDEDEVYQVGILEMPSRELEQTDDDGDDHDHEEETHQSHILATPPRLGKQYESGQFGSVKDEFGFSSTPIRGGIHQVVASLGSNETDESNPTSGDTLLIDEDFSYLAGFVGN